MDTVRLGSISVEEVSASAVGIRCVEQGTVDGDVVLRFGHFIIRIRVGDDAQLGIVAAVRGDGVDALAQLVEHPCERGTAGTHDRMAPVVVLKVSCRTVELAVNVADVLSLADEELLLTHADHRTLGQEPVALVLVDEVRIRDEVHRLEGIVVGDDDGVVSLIGQEGHLPAGSAVDVGVAAINLCGFLAKGVLTHTGSVHDIFRRGGVFRVGGDVCHFG